MSVENVRAGFARLAETVVPEADPYGRLVRRGRRRRRARFAGLSGIVATVVAGALVGAPHFAGVGSPGPSQTGHGYPIESEWVRQLLASPTRGNLAADKRFVADVEAVFGRERGRALAPDGLSKATVLFAHEVGNTRTVAVAFHSDDRAGLVVKADRAGASATELLDAGGMFDAPVTPFLTFLDTRSDQPGMSVTHFTVGLAPNGCEVSTSDSAMIGPDGAVRRQWRAEPTGSYVVREGDYRMAARELWRVTCAGQVRHQAPAQRVDEVGDRAPTATVASDGARGTVDGVTAAAAGEVWRDLTGATGIATAGPSVLWGGSIPDKRAGVPAVLVGPSTGRGPVVLQMGARGEAMVALGGRGAAGLPAEVETLAASRADWSLAATSVGAGVLVAVRVPEREGGHAVLGERLLVLGPPTAVRVVAVGAGGAAVAEAQLDGGAGLLSVPWPANVTLRVFDGRGDLVADAPFVEQDGLRLFGEQLISNW